MLDGWNLDHTDVPDDDSFIVGRFDLRNINVEIFVCVGNVLFKNLILYINIDVFYREEAEGRIQVWSEAVEFAPATKPFDPFFLMKHH